MSDRAGKLWGRQLLAILRLELRKGFRGRRSLGLCLLAFIPPLILLLRLIFPVHLDAANLAEATHLYSSIYQGFLLRFVIFIACVAVFGNLIRREALERTLHYYFLAPVRREVLVLGKFLTGLIVTIVLLEASTLAAFALSYAPHDGVGAFLFRGPGLGHLGSYLLMTLLACIGYGAVFFAFGFFFKSPALPALAVFGWEGIHFLLPPFLKQLSVIHYLQPLTPVPMTGGPLAILADAPSPLIAVPGLLLFAAALVALSAWRIRGMEISYEES